jgi:hypothetical protein
MSDVTAPAITPRRIHPLTIVASVLYLAFAVISIFLTDTFGSFLYLFENLTRIGESFGYGIPNGLVNLHFVFLLPILPLAAVAAAVLGIVSKKAILQPLLGASIFVLFYVLSWILQGIAIALGDWEVIFLFPGYGQDVFAWLITGLLLIAILLSGLAWLSSKNGNSTPIQTASANALGLPKAQPSAPVRDSGSYANLPMFALIGAFVIPLAGIILGHLSLSYMKKGQLSTQNKGMATAGLILGYVFVGLGFLTGLILGIALIISASTGY